MNTSSPRNHLDDDPNRSAEPDRYLGQAADHIANQIVYGPVVSRRLGRSLGVGFSSPDVWDCSWSCAYCQCDHLPRAHQPLPAHAIVQAVAAACERPEINNAEKRQSIEAVTLAGNGEPSLHPDFAEIVRELRALIPARSNWSC